MEQMGRFDSTCTSKPGIRPSGEESERCFCLEVSEKENARVILADDVVSTSKTRPYDHKAMLSQPKEVMDQNNH